MPIYRLTNQLLFPPVQHAEDGVIAVGGDLRPERLLLAYRSAIFPWYHDGLPIIWHSPDPRCVLWTRDLHVSRSMGKVLRKKAFEVRLDTAFSQVIRACQQADRPGQDGTWITSDMEVAYNTLHQQGLAHSVECWQDGRLVGGLYGVCLGRMFFGESMFSHVPNASKTALVGLVEVLRRWDFQVVDCQVANAHTVSLGAVELPRREYVQVLAQELAAAPQRTGSWTSEGPFFPGLLGQDTSQDG